MQGHSSGGGLVAAALILGASILGGAYLLTMSIDRGSAQLAGLNESLKTAAKAPAAAARPSAPRLPAARIPRRSMTSRWATRRSAVPRTRRSPSSNGPTSNVRSAFASTRRSNRLPKNTATRFASRSSTFRYRCTAKARAAHQASEAAHRQGKFWEMHDRIFARPKDLSPETYLRYAGEIGLDIDKYNSDLSSSSVRKVVDADLAMARELGVSGTPSFFINGRFLSGAQPYQSFARVIDEELAKN